MKKKKGLHWDTYVYTLLGGVCTVFSVLMLIFFYSDLSLLAFISVIPAFIGISYLFFGIFEHRRSKYSDYSVKVLLATLLLYVLFYPFSFCINGCPEIFSFLYWFFYTLISFGAIISIFLLFIALVVGSE